MSNAFTTDRERTVYMGDATHRKPTAKPEMEETNMKTINEQLTEMIEDKMDELAHTLIEDLPHGATGSAHWLDGFVEALEWMLEMIE